MDIIKSIEHEQLKKKTPTLNIGDTVKVHIRVVEGTRERIQVFEGTIIKKQGGGSNETFTVRRISYGVGVEKTFLVHSPRVEKVEVIRVGKARRAKLYYLRDRIGKSAGTKEKIGARIPRDEDYEEAPEEVVEAEVEEIEVIEEAPVEVVAEAIVEVAQVEETPDEVITEETEAIVEEAPTEVPSEETETVVEETVDTVTEEPVEVVKEEKMDTVTEEPAE